MPWKRIRTDKYDSNRLICSSSATYSTFHLTSETDEAGLVTTYTYDGAGRRPPSPKAIK